MKMKKIKYSFNSILFLISSVMILISQSGCENSDPCFCDFNKKDIIVVLPADGCSGCINATLVVLNKYSDHRYLKIVAVMYSSKKELRLRIGDELFQSDNLYYRDSLNVNCKVFDSHTHPCILYPDNRSECVVIDPNSASKILIDLENYLNRY